MAVVAKERGVEKPSELFSVVWAPFQLNPHAPEESVDKRDVYIRKFGKERVERMIPYMEETGKKEGIRFSYGGTLLIIPILF